MPKELYVSPDGTGSLGKLFLLQELVTNLVGRELWLLKCRCVPPSPTLLSSLDVSNLSLRPCLHMTNHLPRIFFQCIKVILRGVYVAGCFS